MKLLELIAITATLSLAFLLWVTILFYGAEAMGNILDSGFSWKDISLFFFMIFSNFFIVVSIVTMKDPTKRSSDKYKEIS